MKELDKNIDQYYQSGSHRQERSNGEIPIATAMHTTRSSSRLPDLLLSSPLPAKEPVMSWLPCPW
jgi:hypothetical protein